MLILQLDMDQQGGDYTLHTQLLEILHCYCVERLHITHTGTKPVHNAGYCVTAIVCSVAGLGAAASY